MSDTARNVITIHGGALDELEDGTIILRGVVDAGSIKDLRIDEYQREYLEMYQIREKMNALAVGACPDIDLGMRGGNYTDKNGTFELSDPVYVIDGQQRCGWAKEMMEKGEDPHLGATIHFNTTREWEEARFYDLNQARLRVSSNVLMRNKARTNQGLKILLEVSLDPAFVLRNRICWNQKKNAEQLLTAATYIKVVARLHAGVAPGMINQLHHLGLALERFAGANRAALRNNTLTYFKTIHESWGLDVSKKTHSPQTSNSFLMALSRVLAEDGNCWKNNMFVPSDKMRKRLKVFNPFDPHVRQLCFGHGQASKVLYQYMIEQIYSTKKMKRPKPVPIVEEEAIPSQPNLTAITPLHV
jgi:hypothetical protein